LSNEVNLFKPLVIYKTKFNEIRAFENKYSWQIVSNRTFTWPDMVAEHAHFETSLLIQNGGA
jgi:hypothetical protein